MAAVLARSFRIVADGVDDNGAPWSLRTAPSAGATHPFDLLVTANDVRGLQRGHYVYGPNAISLRGLNADQGPYADILSAAVTSASRRLEPAPVSLCLVANVERTAQRYLTTLTLLLRDAGALLATLHLVATDLGLRSSIVGTAGHFDYRQTISPTVVDCGGLVLGRA
ncbi:MAG TPA: nitroreductase family protein [Nonomuraea sp.]|nr:nitroreductase family protein [Nonomuraea sp.]